MDELYYLHVGQVSYRQIKERVRFSGALVDTAVSFRSTNHGPGKGLEVPGYDWVDNIKR